MHYSYFILKKYIALDKNVRYFPNFYLFIFGMDTSSSLGHSYYGFLFFIKFALFI